jgi:hypothetical protein
MLTPLLDLISLDQVLHWAPPIFLATLGAWLFWKTRPHAAPAAGNVDQPNPTPAPQPIDPSQLPPRDVSLSDAIWRAFMGKWGERKKEPMEMPNDPEAVRFYDICEEFTQHAFDGKLPIWAVRTHSNLFEPIPWEFWRNRRINPGNSILPGVTDVWVEFTRALEVGDMPHCRDRAWGQFMTNKEMIEKLWPAAPSKAPASQPQRKRRRRR